MPTIKFSHEYVKMHGQTKKAQLLAMRIIYPKDINIDLLEYDTKVCNNLGYYPLQTDRQLILLVLLGDKNIVYQTLRTYSTSKWDYYHSNIGTTFDIFITNNDNIKLNKTIKIGDQSILG